MIITALLLFMLDTTLHAELIDHHNTQADSEGSADYCLTCHNASGGGQIRMCSTICTITAHKFLVQYPPPGREKEFATTSSVLAAGIKLENGMITCISCHDLHNPSKYHFAIDKQGFAQKLCLSCHIDIT